MAIIRCKICGAELKTDFESDACICRECKTPNSMPSLPKARLTLSVRDYDGAKEIYKSIIGLDSSNVEARMGYTLAVFKKANISELLPEYSPKRNEDSLKVPTLDEALEMGEIALKKGDFVLALMLYEVATSCDSFDGRARLGALLAECEKKDISELGTMTSSFENSLKYQNALTYCDERVVKELEAQSAKSKKKRRIRNISIFSALGVVVCIACLIFGISMYRTHTKNPLFSYERVDDGYILAEYTENRAMLENVEIPSTHKGKDVIGIGEGAFKSAKHLTSITIPQTITKIGKDAFDGCEALRSVNAQSVDSWIKISFENEKSNPLYYARALNINGEAVSEISIPNGTTCIGNYAFYRCGNIKKVILPVGVTSIGEGAFYECYSLELINIPHGMTIIGKNAFSNCDSLKGIAIPDSVTVVGDDVFYDCYSLGAVLVKTNIRTLSQLGKGVLGKITELTLSGELVSGLVDFSELTSLKKLTIADDVTLIPSEMFKGNESLREVVIGKGVISIDASAFQRSKSLVSVTFGESVAKIDQWAFSYCDALRVVTIPDSVITLEDKVFYSCKALETVVIGNGVTSINEQAFSNCIALKNVALGEKVTTLEKQAFAGCKSLQKILGGALTTIGESAFSGCEGLTSISLPQGVTSIGKTAFKGCTALTYIYIPKSTTSMGEKVFEGCTKLTSIEIGASEIPSTWNGNWKSGSSIETATLG